MTDLHEEVMKRAEHYFDQGLNCAQAVALSNLEILRIPTEGISRLAAGFGHGMNAGCTCGALSGGVLTIGCVLADTQVKGFDQKVVKASAELHRRFVQEFGSTCCRILRKKLSPFKNARCKHITAVTAAITLELLQGNGNSEKPSSFVSIKSS